MGHDMDHEQPYRRSITDVQAILTLIANQLQLKQGKEYAQVHPPPPNPTYHQGVACEIEESEDGDLA